MALAKTTYFERWNRRYGITIDNMESLLNTEPIDQLTDEEFPMYDKPFINSTERKLLEEMIFHEKAKDLHEKANKSMLLRYADLHCSIIDSIYKNEQYSCKVGAIFETDKEYILVFHYGATIPVDAGQIIPLNEWYYKTMQEIQVYFNKEDGKKHDRETLWYCHDDGSKDDITIHIKPKEKGYWILLESVMWSHRELNDLIESGF